MPTPQITSATARTVTIDGRELLCFAGCNYLGLAQHPRVLEAVRGGLAKYGVSAGASRTTTGNFDVFEELEARMARALGCDAAVLLPDGYTANIALAQILGRQRYSVIIDKMSHQSLKDAAQCAGLRLLTYAHLEPIAAEDVAAGEAVDPVAIVTDGVFTASGGVAPLPDLLRCLPDARGLLVVDDSHGFGVLGPRGHGTVSHFGLADQRLFVTTTLAKAIGCAGGVVAGLRPIIDAIRERASAYVGTTPIPPAIAAGAIAALDVLDREPERLARLRTNTAAMRSGLAGLGLVSAEATAPVPIFTFTLDRPERMEALRDRLDKAGILAPVIRYPGGRAESYFRLIATSEHTAGDIDRLIQSIRTSGVI